MSARTVRRKPAKGFKVQPKGSNQADFRVMTSLPERDYRILQWWANRHERPLSEELRRAVWAYVYALRGEFNGSKGKGETANVDD